MSNVVVIMRSRNSAWVIHQALASLFSQRFRDFSLVVVDSGSTDRTMEMLSAYPHQLIRIEGASYQPGPVLNAAIAGTEAQQLVFWNSDAVALHDGVLGQLVDALAHADAAYARQIPRPDAHGWVRRDYAASFPACGAAPSWIALSLVCSAMRRTAWKAHAFYAEAWASEDTEWGVWARNNGLTVTYVPEALVMHSHNYTLSQLFGRRFVEGEADAFIYKQQHGYMQAIRRGVADMVRDWWWCLRRGDIGGFCAAPGRRLVSQWAYLRGHILGSDRRNRGDHNATTGQTVVLSRHESQSGARP